MSNDLIEKRDERTKQRKARKKRIDSLIGLSANDEGKEVMTLSASVATVSDTDQTARLLDEGYCDNGFVLKKGTLEKYLNGENEYVTGWEMKDGSWQRTEVLNLTDDFVGTVNLGHKDFATDPYILGEFKKSDLTLVDIENDRKALDIAVRLDEDSMFVKELRRQPYDIGVSAEFYYHVDYEATDKLYQEYGMWMPVIDEIFIFAYGLVGECGNVNSSGLTLKGETMKNEANIEEQVIGTENLEDNTEQLLGENEVEIEPTAGVEEGTVDNEQTDAAENAEEGEAEEGAEGNEAGGEEGDDADEAEGDEADVLEEAATLISELRAQVEALSKENEELKEANASLKKSNRKANSKLQKEIDKKEQFMASIKGVSAELLPDEAEKAEEEKQEELKATEKKNYYRGDGIGEI